MDDIGQTRHLLHLYNALRILDKITLVHTKCKDASTSKGFVVDGTLGVGAGADVNGFDVYGFDVLGVDVGVGPLVVEAGVDGEVVLGAGVGTLVVVAGVEVGVGPLVVGVDLDDWVVQGFVLDGWVVQGLVLDGQVVQGCVVGRNVGVGCGHGVLVG
ncbi:hypothetical protein SPRG_01330 [Saprolegnia parasitica CBS 223.65]|uniref:Uncharacterized protein n=1 Tax=Saprolegnia parasitica (strain CBS 223.65) TaxID=695850 RepID=A0A067D5S9_SAPPC|nr:hypothetical protein SPRG_01330 [Saprolegnia parasitica CBS 223.65]KDO34056.1 hypothetical protein SPRG_01330 [Saprolegnia parasitica CBS 223.65]|eukprot:XP_012194940.1 hypothetical protein SPRG_01330 [Saprolegnia parasitica CBS 223.65]